MTNTGGVDLPDRIGIGVLTRLIGRDLVDEVLAETGRIEQRRRLLPARVVVYYVMALCLFFGDAYEEVMRKLVGALQWLDGWDSDWQVPTASALCQARQRLGEEPLRVLFERVAQPMLPTGGRGWYAGLRVMALDGLILDVPDTSENVAEFGRTGNHLADSPYPQARIVALLECGSRAVVAAEIGPCHTGERQLAQQLLDLVDQDTLLLADRGFYGYDFFKTAANHAQLLWRVNRVIRLPVYQLLPDGSYLSALAPKSMHTMVAAGNARRREHLEIPVRVVEYTITNRGNAAEDAGGSAGGSVGEPQTVRLVTSILDHELAPAVELAELYHQRWEIELAFDEIETHQIGHRVLRSRSPQLVRQEIWALLLTHYAIRHLMLEAADDIDTEPDRISFLRTLRIVRRQVSDQAAFSPQHPRHEHQKDDH